MRGFRLNGGRWFWREHYLSHGSPGSVDFDWEKAWDDKAIVGWRHTHPGVKFDTPSSVDDRTMTSWVKALGRPVVCGVTCGESTRYYQYCRSRDRDCIARFELTWNDFGFFKSGTLVLPGKGKVKFADTDQEWQEWEDIGEAIERRRERSDRW
jgi:hypothetical protein